MNDPTRIDGVLAKVKDAWEGQPEISLATLFGMLSNAGFGWGTTDQQLATALEAMARIHPSHFPIEDVSAVWFVEAEDPDSHKRIQVTLNGSTAVVEYRNTGRPLQPVVWKYTKIRPTGPLRTLVIADSEGFEHRLGIVQRITRLASPLNATLSLNGFKRAELGEWVYIAQGSGSTVRIGRHLEIYSKQRRELDYRSSTWHELLQCEQGKPLIFVNSVGEQETLSEVEALVIAQAPSLQLEDLDA